MAIIIFAGYHFFTTTTARADLYLACASVFLGFIVETVYLQYGVLIYSFNKTSPQFAPFWILILWASFALTLNTGLRWLQGRHLAAAILGFIGGPLAYFGGVKLGAATIGLMPAIVYLSIGLSWAVVTPALLLLARTLNYRLN